jgi:hypothetical protein
MTSRPRNQRSARPAFRALSLAVSLTACSALAGCGATRAAHTPALTRADAAPIVSLARKISGEHPCAQRRDIRLLQQRALALVNEERVPANLQDPFLSGVNALAADTPPCVPPVPVQRTPVPADTPPHPHGHHEHGHGKEKKH